MKTKPLIGKQKLTIPPAEAKVIAAMADGVDPVVAVNAAGYTMSDKNSKTLATELWRRHVTANGSMMEAMAEEGINPSFVAKKFKQLLEAQNTVVSKHGIVEVNDNTTQIKALDMVMKTTGAYAAKATISTELKFENILLEIEGLDD
jgi:hypothetical protein